MAKDPQQVAVVGGGIAGLYAAYRLMSQKPQSYEVSLFESSSRLGGRICSQDIPGLPFNAELGAMRFPERHRLLVNLIDHLEIPTKSFDVGPLKLYVRGRHLTPKEVADGYCRQCRSPIPYKLKKEEQEQLPSELVKLAVREFLKDLTFAKADAAMAHHLRQRVQEDWLDCVQNHWHDIRDFGRYHGIALQNIGFWNLLQHYLSNEASEYIHAAMGLDSVLGNWSAAVAIPWFLADFGLDTYHMIPGGTERICEKLVKRLERDCTIHRERPVTRVRRQDDHWYLQCGETGSEGPFDLVILAVPKSPLERIQFEGLGEDWRPRWLGQVRSHRLFKLFLLYDDVWWKGMFESDKDTDPDTGRIFTDLPLRQVFYFGPGWMQEHGDPLNGRAFEGSDQWGLIMASYSDEQSASFWHSPDLVEDLAGQEEFYGCPYYREPLGLSEPYEKRALRSVPQDLRARDRTVRKIHKLLQEIHDDIEIPDPVLGVFKDWGDQPYGGGWHTWDIGTRPWALASRPQLAEGLFVCGEAYSDEQGWIEGALKSAELVLGSLGVASPKWWPAADEDLPHYIAP